MELKYRKTIVAIIAVVSITDVNAAASSLSLTEAQRNIDRLERERQQENIREEKQREQRFQQDNAKKSEAYDNQNKTSRHRFVIKDIVVENDNKYEFSAQRNEIIDSYLNKDMGEQEILFLVKELTNFYISHGYVTTQVTIVPGSLRQGKLVLKVLWGKVEGFSHNGEKSGWREKTRMFSAMPFAKDRLLNISDVDQGLDNLLRVSSSDKLQIEPAQRSGYSLINHKGESVFPLSAYVGINNSGYRDTGWYQYYLNTSLKNIAGLNDIFTWYYSYNDLYAQDDNQSSKSFTYSVPLGYWLFDTSYYKSRYQKMIGGTYGGYDSNGYSERLSFKASRTLYRNASGKFMGYMKVEKRNNENNIMGSTIAISSKNYGNLNAGLTWVGGLGGGWGFADLSMTAGVPWFDTVWKNDADLAGYDLNYKKVNAIVSWSKRLINSASGTVAVDYELNSGFQFTNNILVSDARYTIGDEYSVRGFKDTTVSAERGTWISHTIKIPVQIHYARIYQIAPFAGLDAGMARRNCPASVGYCVRDYMSGAAVGIKISAKDFSGSFTTGWPVTKPASLRNTATDNYTMYMNFGVGF